MFIRKLTNKGDTIVEVMIALTVLMLIIGGGYSIATRSLNGVQVAQERSEATKIAEGQLEAIRWKVQDNSNLSVLNTDGFINASGVEWNDLIIPSVTWKKVPFCVVTTKVDSPPPEHTTIEAKTVGDVSDPCSQGIDGRYKVSVTTDLTFLNYNNDPNLDKKQITYKVTVKWDRAGGGGEESIVVADRYVVI
ncbi:hypothetical protein KC947_01350 [Candidatus Saccharibacteria bacterium]|nr:hypothetical protein [Candidatus Saccharibacteria bacterium]